MKNVLRALVYDGQVSLTLIDATQIVQEGIKLHNLSPASAYVFGKALSVMAFMSACLKERKGEISFTVKGNGEGGEICVSGNFDMRIRGYIEKQTCKKYRILNRHVWERTALSPSFGTTDIPVRLWGRAPCRLAEK